MAFEDPKRLHTTGSFPVGQLNFRQKSFVAFGYVPKGVIHRMLKLTFNFESGMKKQSFKTHPTISVFFVS
jgi:hypothetical protein